MKFWTMPAILGAVILATAACGGHESTQPAAITAPVAIPPTPTPTPTPTPEPVFCPQATPVAFIVDPVISPTDQLSQVIAGTSGGSVTVTTQSGTFTATGGYQFSVNVTLLPNTTNYLEVVADVAIVRRGDCTYGGYSLSKQVVIQHGGLPPPQLASTVITPDNAAQLEELGAIYTGSAVSDVIFGSSKEMIVVGSSITHWAVGTWQETNRYGDLGSAAGVGAISPDSSLVAATVATRESQGVVTWDTTTGVSREMAEAEYYRSLSFAFNPGATRLAGGDNVGHVVIWNVVTGQIINEFEGDGFERFLNLHWLDDDTLIGAGGKRIYRWNVGTGEFPEPLALPVTRDEDISYGKEDIAISRDGKRFAGVAGNFIFYWDGEASEWAVWQSSASRFLPQIVFVPGGRLLATVSIGESGLQADGKLLLWNINTQELVATLPIGERNTLRFSPDGRYIAGFSIFGDPVVSLWGLLEEPKSYNVFKGDTIVMWIEDAPGTLLSTAPPPPRTVR